MPAQLADPRFRARRVENWVLLGLLYAFFYMSRYNFSANASALAMVMGWTKTDLGVFETWMPTVYGLSVLLNGPLADRIGGRKAFLIGGAGVTVMNVLFGLGSLFVAAPAQWAGTGADRHLVHAATLSHGLGGGTLLTLLATVWGINGFFQSFGALSIVKVNAHWFEVRERGTFAGIFGVLIRIGLLLGFSATPFLVAHLGGWQWAFWVPAGFVGVTTVLNFFFMRDSPEEAGYGHFETGDAVDADDGARVTFIAIVRKVFGNPTMWAIALASMMIGVVRRSTIDAWYPVFFSDTFNPGKLGDFAPYQLAVWGIAAMGIVGGFAFGITSDRVYGGRRGPVITIGFGAMVALLLLFGLLNRGNMSPWVAACLLASLSFFVNGAHGMIGGAASMDFGGRKGAASAAGLFDGMQYLASGPIAGAGMGWMLARYKWAWWPFAPVPFALVGALVMAKLWNARPGAKAH